MPDPITISEYDFAIAGDLEKRAVKPQPETPFRILLVGDFSGRTSRGEGNPARLRPVAIDRDNIDAVLRSMQVEIALPLAGKKQGPVTIGFAEMDDFHPDRIYQRLEIFAELRDMREALDDPAALAMLSDELREQPPATEMTQMPPRQQPRRASGCWTRSLIRPPIPHPGKCRSGQVPSWTAWCGSWSDPIWWPRPIPAGRRCVTRWTGPAVSCCA